MKTILVGMRTCEYRFKTNAVPSKFVKFHLLRSEVFLQCSFSGYYRVLSLLGIARLLFITSCMSGKNVVVSRFRHGDGKAQSPSTVTALKILDFTCEGVHESRKSEKDRRLAPGVGD